MVIELSGVQFGLKSYAWSSSETQGQIVGPKTKIKTGGKKFDEQKYERKIRAPGDKLFTHQFQTAERILVPDWAGKPWNLIGY